MFFLVSGLKCNITKCEIAGIGGHFSYSKKLEQEMNFQRHILKLENFLRLRRLRNLTIEGKVLVFKLF